MSAVSTAESREASRRDDGRFGVQTHSEPEAGLSTNPEDGLPSALPQHLRHLAYATDLLRRLCDNALPERGAGICLPASAIIGHLRRREGVDARLVCGTYKGSPHWWVAADGFVFDSSAGQFSEDLLSVSEEGTEGYVAEDDFPCGHTNEDLLYAEARRAFGDPSQADYFVDLALQEISDARNLSELGLRLG